MRNHCDNSCDRRYTCELHSPNNKAKVHQIVIIFALETYPIKIFLIFQPRDFNHIQEK